MFDVVAIGELLIDFAPVSVNAGGYPTVAAHPGGAPANYLAALSKFGKSTALIGKVGNDAFGKLLLNTLEGVGISTKGMIVDDDSFTTLAFVTLDDKGDREFSFARKPGADTRLQTEDREYVLPLTARGKPKKLTATSVRSVTPFGCTFHVQMMRSRKRGAVGGKVFLYNQRAKRDFPVGEQEEAAGIESDADFHAFMARYMATCPVDYFDRLEAFRRAEKVTIRYRVGDVFRMSYDRTHYCYGIITGEVKKVKALPEFPQVHSLRWTMMVPIMVRLYALETERADMTPEELRQYPLGRMIVCADNDIIWGNYPIIGHRSLTAEDIEFQLIPDVQKLGQGFADKVPFNVQVEWGLCSTVVPYRRIPEELRQKLIDLHYGAHYNGVLGGIPPEFALPEQHCAHWVMHQKNLLNPHNDALRGEILMLTGLPADADMDDFARAFGGLTRAEIAQRVQEGT